MSLETLTQKFSMRLKPLPQSASETFLDAVKNAKTVISILTNSNDPQNKMSVKFSLFILGIESMKNQIVLLFRYCKNAEFKLLFKSDTTIHRNEKNIEKYR